VGSAVYFWQNILLIPPVRDGHTFPLTFIPSDNQNIIVKARFSPNFCFAFNVKMRKNRIFYLI
jgi:hypothetical protein